MANTLKPIPLGTEFHWLTVDSFSHRSADGEAFYNCTCKCGKKKAMGSGNLKNGHAKSCGCRRAINGKLKLTTHGLSYYRLYSSWKNSIVRCYDTTDKAYHAYGGRGIRVCEFIRSTPANLLFLIGERPPKLTLDRIDNNGNYSCGKCAECLKCGWKFNIRGAPKEIQVRNTRQNHWLTYNGVTKIIKDWARDAGIPRKTFYNRWKRGVDPFKNIQSKAQQMFEENKKG